jgi:2'-5' RNA ligase
MKTTGSQRMGYTHFIGVVAPESLADAVESCRRWMSERYGCSSGYRTAPHVTLIAPFACADPRGVGPIEEALARWAFGRRGFECTVSGFGAFAERTIYAHVVASRDWTLWRDDLARELNAECPGLVAVDRRPFIPHLTVANRDIPPGAVAPALTAFSELSLHETFVVDHAALFEWGNGAWAIRGQVECRG